MLITSGLFFLMILVSGYLLSGIGKPYNILIITFHKLAGLALGIYLGVLLFRHAQHSGLAISGIVAIAVTVVFFLILVVSGSLLSAANELPGVVQKLHSVFPYLTVAAATILLMLVF